MSLYPIEKGIPVPSSRKPRQNVYPWPTMEVGDSFFVAWDDRVEGARRAAYMQSRDGGKQFIARKAKDGLRIWRVA